MEAVGRLAAGEVRERGLEVDLEIEGDLLRVTLSIVELVHSSPELNHSPLAS